jgi:hypothetical protein
LPIAEDRGRFVAISNPVGDYLGRIPYTIANSSANSDTFAWAMFPKL